MNDEIKKSPRQLHPHVRNMIIGITTTVLVSGTVYFLGFHKKDNRASKAEKQKATTEAWKTYVRLENNYAKNTALLIRDGGKFFTSYGALYQEMMKESDRFVAGIQNLITKEDVDQDMVTVLKRRAENEKTSNPRVEKLYRGWDVLMDYAQDSGWTEQQFMDTVVAQSKAFEQQTKGVMDRALTEIEYLTSTLSKRYNQEFNLDDLFIIQIYKYKKDLFSLLADEKTDSTLAENVTREYLTGKWDAFGATVTLRADNSWTWFAPYDSSEAIGNWELKKGQLLLHVEKHPKLQGKGLWAFNLSNVTDTSFSMYLSKEPFNFYTLVRK